MEAFNAKKGEDGMIKEEKKLKKLSGEFSRFLPAFLVADTRLYTLPCRSVGRSVGPSHF